MEHRLITEIEQEEDGRYIADVVNMPGVLAYGHNPWEAKANAVALALRCIGNVIEQDGRIPAFVVVG